MKTMKKTLLMYIGIALLVGIVGGYAIFQFSGSTKNFFTQQTNRMGRGFVGSIGQGKSGQKNGTCMVDELLTEETKDTVSNLSVNAQKALEDAINDEYKAFSTYQAVINKLGPVRPFSMIIRAEEQHIALLKALFDKYGIKIPVNSWIGTITAPVTLKEACQMGVDAEIANANLYKIQLLSIVKNNTDILAVFMNLMNASEQKHLVAFERCN